jgi:hypothetical protein
MTQNPNRVIWRHPKQRAMKIHDYGEGRLPLSFASIFLKVGFLEG